MGRSMEFLLFVQQLGHQIDLPLRVIRVAGLVVAVAAVQCDQLVGEERRRVHQPKVLEFVPNRRQCGNILVHLSFGEGRRGSYLVEVAH